MERGGLLNIHLNLNGDNGRASHDSDASNGRPRQSINAHSSRHKFLLPARFNLLLALLARDARGEIDI